VKYLDIGHLSNVTDCGYLANKPDLEVAIIAMTAIIATGKVFFMS
jgi:hypothetical protein